MEKFSCTTAHPSEPLIKPIWMLRIAKKAIDLSKVDARTFLGICILNSYPKNPEQTLMELAQQACDNPELVKRVIGAENMSIIF